MGGRFAQAAKIVGCRGQAEAEELLPDAVDHYARGERIVASGQFAGEGEPAAFAAGQGGATEDFKKAAWHGAFGLEVVAAGEERRIVTVTILDDSRRPG